MADRARITHRTVASSVTVPACLSDVRIALNTPIIAVSLVLLPGAVWMHAT